MTADAAVSVRIVQLVCSVQRLTGHMASAPAEGVDVPPLADNEPGYFRSFWGGRPHGQLGAAFSHPGDEPGVRGAEAADLVTVPGGRSLLVGWCQLP